ncbi:PREDICTED: tetratricopeptide repeat protein 8 [Nicrophorus vespilloides]|uniref:Tetratricopeptide repeat protein 8 n=1 Tax=Nicrophorus vespilloides TaxID=110193 RepID=A0ABM1NCN2_NICVS|nr:PREDICTED: tetratricopeptide repeat protein 8 [Nicrophorus vespilloides]
MDPMVAALSNFRRKKYDKCVEICTQLLVKQPLDQAAWYLKMRAMTKRVHVDDIDGEDAMTEDLFDENAVAAAPRPGTSMKTTKTLPMRPVGSAGRPISGIARPASSLQRPGSSLDPRMKTARPITSQSARAIRLGTAAILSQSDGPFIQVSRLNLAKYARDPCLAKPLFEYIFYATGDARAALELAVQATQANEFKDWWWKVQLAKCYVALNLIRDAEQQLRSALKQQYHVETFLRLIRVYLRLDQPLSAAEVCKSALEIFPLDVAIFTELGRLGEALGDIPSSVKHYRNVLIQDATNAEAIACIGVYHFYNYQPELALRYYRRVLAMGAHSAELYNNLGLCCLYSQQLDLVLVCFQRALDLATDPLIKADIWYNLSHAAISSGDIELALNCLNLCLICDSNHASAYNNLAVLQHKLGRPLLAKSYMMTAIKLEPDMPEPHINLEFLKSKI